ncbi:MAG: TolC family protein [Bacteroidales bacterium]|nr:TolC family protein [Bacteroidales bacterium]
MKTKIVIQQGLLMILSLMLSSNVSAQYTIEELQKSAQENYPLIDKYSLLEKSEEFTISNIDRQNLPQVTVVAQATYQSKVTGFPNQMKDIYSQMGIDLKGLNKDQYKAVVDVNQNIWDGGNISASKNIAKAENEVKVKETNLQIYEINKRVNDIFFSLLLLNASQKQNEIYRELLNANLEKVKSFVKNGVALTSDAQMIEVEILKSEQQLVSIESNKEAFLQMLSLLTGKDIKSSAMLLEPTINEYGFSGDIKSPELEIFDSRINLLNKRKEEIKASSMPRISAFVQGMYGNPGLNMFENMINDKWSWDYIAGLRLQWNISSLYYKKNRTKILDTDKEIINNQKETFLFNTNLKISQQQAMILKAEKVLSQDEKIIELRESIRKSGESKLKNGIIDITDLLNDISNENLAKTDRILHKTELLKSIYDLKFTTNN